MSEPCKYVEYIETKGHTIMVIHLDDKVRYVEKGTPEFEFWRRALFEGEGMSNKT